MRKLLAFRHNIILHLLVVSQGAFCGLYTDDDEVILLDSSNFTKSVLGKSHGWVMEFFASWCGHCHNFAPYYKQFAYDIRLWPQVKVGAVDCANQDNEDICLKYEVSGYPTVKFFPPNISTSEVGVLRESWDKRVSSLKADTIQYLETYQDTFNCLPSFEPVADYTDDFSWYEDEEVFFIIEDEYSYVGKEVILNMNSLCDNTTSIVQRLQFIQNTSSLSTKETPALLYWNASFANITNNQVTGEEVQQVLRNHFSQVIGPGLDIAVTDNFHLNPEEEFEISEASGAEVLRRRYTVNLFDLEKTVLLALTNEIEAYRDDMTEERREGLDQFLQVLRQYFPQKSRLHPILHKITSQDLLSREFPISSVYKLGEKYEKSGWQSCRGSRPEFGGYSCGQWMLWHTLTVQQYLKNSGKVTEVLDSMNSYVKHFFGCRSCSQHFINMTQDARNFQHIRTYEESILYLWRAHNMVNYRLTNHSSEDPIFPKLIFPSEDSCPSCYIQNDHAQVQEYFSNSNNLNNDEYKLMFNSTQVVQFLVDMYSEPSTETNSNISAGLLPGIQQVGLALLMAVLMFI